MEKANPGSVYRGAVLLLTFTFGFVLGYKTKEWRIWWTKRKRDMLASQLQKAQKQLEILTTP